MENLIVKPVDVLGSSIMAAKDEKGNIYAGVNYFCNALGMTKGQRDKQVQKVQKDEVLKQGASKLEAGVFDKDNETVVLKIEYVPLWLTKISITEKTKKQHPELAEKLLNYQLKAKDILAAAFLPNQGSDSAILRQQIQTIAKGTEELYQRVDAVDGKVQTVKQEIEALRNDLPLFPSEADEISNAAKRKGVEILGGKDSNAYKDRSLQHKVYTNIYANLKYNFAVGSYKAIKRGQREVALKIVEEYEPPFFLAEQIKEANAQQSLNLGGGAANV